MTKEALKLALEALENYAWHEEACPQHPTYSEPKNYPKCTCGYDKVITAIKEALAQTQEPVAWIHNFIEGGISIGKRPADLNRHPDRWTALYKDPKPCPTCEALARTVMLDQTSHDTTPPQRTEQESDDIASILACRDMLDAQPVPPRTEQLKACVYCGQLVAKEKT